MKKQIRVHLFKRKGPVQIRLQNGKVTGVTSESFAFMFGKTYGDIMVWLGERKIFFHGYGYRKTAEDNFIEQLHPKEKSNERNDS